MSVELIFGFFVGRVSIAVEGIAIAWVGFGYSLVASYRARFG